MPKEPELDPLNSFFVVDDDRPTFIVDRSDLEDWTICPMRGHLKAQQEQLPSDAMETGSLAHEALGATVRAYLESRGQMSPGDIRDELENELRTSRPDLQPEVYDSVKRSVWSFAEFLAGTSPLNILRFDGGEGEQSGQLAHDIDTGGAIIRATSELDFLYSGPQAGLLHEIDYKSGRTHWTQEKVRDSFQFQLHTLLVFANYPEVDALEIRVWMTRNNRLTYSTLIERKDVAPYKARIYGAAMEYAKNSTQKNPNLIPTWGTIEKCEACPVLMDCTIGTKTNIGKLTLDPVNAVHELSAMKERVKKLETALAKVVDRDGDFNVGNGFWFGRNKPSKLKPATYRLDS